MKAFANSEPLAAGDKIVEDCLKKFGKCDILINNAGNLRDKSFNKMSKEDWFGVLDVHLQGTFSLSHAVWPHMQQQQFGRIINIGSGAGLYGNFGQANYSSAKMALFGLTNTLAKEGVSSFSLFSEECICCSYPCFNDRKSIIFESIVWCLLQNQR